MAHPDVVVCGAGIAGAAAAYHLAVRQRVPNVIVVDEREPLTLTSDKGTQGYRNWFDGPDDTMVRFVSRSLDLLEELAGERRNAFELSRYGYAFVTADPSTREQLRAQARRLASFGAGEPREHTNGGSYRRPERDDWRTVPNGADLLLDPDLVRESFAFVSRDAIAVSHVRRAGWLDAVRLGRWLLEQSVAHGARVVRDRVAGVHVDGGAVRGVRLASGTLLPTRRLVVAAGPGLPAMLGMLGIELPVFLELHAKMRFDDRLGVVPRSAPFTIWVDPVSELGWSDEERTRFHDDPSTQWLLRPFPGGLHVRPVGGVASRDIFLIWTFESEPQPFVWPPAFDPHLGEVLLRGLARMIPGAEAYRGEGARGRVDGGYYTKTPENRPLVGPLPIDGAFLIGALSGYGVMASQAAAELLAAHVTGAPLPPYADAFSPARYDDPAYRRRLESWDAKAGQL
jgi:glycine/D-amino acid oxidase-like deaminating enzyme